MTDQQINKLYFLALIPDVKLRAKVKSLKEELKINYNAVHALKSPAHITLQMPFRRPEGEEQHIITTLKEFSGQQLSFEINLEGFDCFNPRVIFIRVVNHHPIIDLHIRLNRVLSNELNFNPKVLTRKLHPHMTIATRDLSEAAFDKAWPHYTSRYFKASFNADGFFLLKHNGKYWDIYQEFQFGG